MAFTEKKSWKKAIQLFRRLNYIYISLLLQKEWSEKIR